MHIEWAARDSPQPAIGNELDLALIHNAVLTICSCKTGRPVARQEADPNTPIYQLETIARSTGLFCRRVLITNRFDLPPAFAERARIFGIQVIAGPDLPRLGELLTRGAEARGSGGAGEQRSEGDKEIGRQGDRERGRTHHPCGSRITFHESMNP